MVKLIMLVGLPASGKSTYAKELAIKYNAHIHSSDEIREELFEDVNDQSDNEKVFQVLHQRIKYDLLQNINCIYDATNISYKKRKDFLQRLDSKDLHLKCQKICVLMATPYECCIEFNKKRTKQIPEVVITKMYKMFDVPYYYEGWDKIIIKYPNNNSIIYGTPYEFVEKYKDYNQNNLHHTMTLGKHCNKAVEYLNRFEQANNSFLSTELFIATMIHDCGKPFCKSFIDNKGEEIIFTNTDGEQTKAIHYYNHEHTGSYDSLFFDLLDDKNELDKLYIATLIRWHMQPYFWEKDNNTKLESKYRNLWGTKLYNDIYILHYADKYAH